MKLRVAVKAIVERNGRFLMIKKSKEEDVTPETWDLPGGGIDDEETPEEALIREVKEESGLDVKILFPTRTWMFITEDQTKLIGISFYCKCEGDQKVELSVEHDEYKWVAPDELSEFEETPKWIIEEFETADKMIGLSLLAGGAGHHH